MTKSKKQIKEMRESLSAYEKMEEQLKGTNEAYTKGAFKYLRFLVHFLGALQFAYATYYYWFYVHYPSHVESEKEAKARWGGKFKFLTFLNVIVQAIYHFVALLNDMFGSNKVEHLDFTPKLRKIRDYMFSALAFPLAHFVCISFWVIYAIDRELIYPAALDAIFPNWLNHVVHTNVAMLAILDLFTCFRKYPFRVTGLTLNAHCMILYIIWMHIVRSLSGQWPYPLLEILNIPMRYVMLSLFIGFNVFCYLLGEFFNNIIWAPEIKLLKQKLKIK